MKWSRAVGLQALGKARSSDYSNRPSLVCSEYDIRAIQLVPTIFKIKQATLPSNVFGLCSKRNFHLVLGPRQFMQVFDIFSVYFCVSEISMMCLLKILSCRCTGSGNKNSP